MNIAGKLIISAGLLVFSLALAEDGPATDINVARPIYGASSTIPTAIDGTLGKFVPASTVTISLDRPTQVSRVVLWIKPNTGSLQIFKDDSTEPLKTVRTFGKDQSITFVFTPAKQWMTTLHVKWNGATPTTDPLSTERVEVYTTATTAQALPATVSPAQLH